jgi:hypothetical protein
MVKYNLKNQGRQQFENGGVTTKKKENCEHVPLPARLEVQHNKKLQKHKPNLVHVCFSL